MGKGFENLTNPYMGEGESKIAKIILTLLMNGPLWKSAYSLTTLHTTYRQTTVGKTEIENKIKLKIWPQ